MTVREDAPTLRRDPLHASASPSAARVNLEATTLDDAGHATRYRVGDLLGEGGMGEVRTCRDRRVGRELAMKVVRPVHGGDEAMRERFLREARIQGQLEHPCIVPVYDIGLGADGATYFTMKRVRGHTLESILEALRAGDDEARKRWTRRRILADLSTVCGAVAYAHARGVVHRDLKPANVMLGDFGEVYVLDWGIARLVDDPAADPSERVQAPVSAARQTAQGAIVGTPGYMAPEQLMAVTDLDGRADVYALGAILYEVLTLRPLHAGDTVEALMASTLTGDAPRPSEAAPAQDVAPELDALCRDALTRDRTKRLASAQAMREALEHYLDGDRDVARRRALASELAASASKATERVLAGDEPQRVEALRDVGRALALDAENHDALRTFVRLLLAPPRDVPAEVKARLAAEEDAQLRSGARGGIRAYVTWLLFVPSAFLLGVRDWVPLALAALFIAAAGALSWWFSRGGRFRFGGQYTLMALTVLGIVSSSRLFGPFMLVPAAIVACAAPFAMMPDRKRRIVVLAIGAAGMLAPALADVSGLIAPSYIFRDNTVVLTPQMTDLPPTLTFVGILAIHLATLITSTRLFWRIRDAFADASLRLHVFAWQLRQIVPDGPR
jgi:serine/threonine-protein kinase